MLSAARSLAGSLARASGARSTGVYGTARAFSDKFGNDTHDDFKPQFKGEPVGVEDMIKKDISAHKVFLYMKGNPAAPMCGFSNQACRILDAYGVQYGSRDVLVDPELREAVKRFSQWPTIPQVFVDGEFVGGSDILMNMHQTGELTPLLHSEDKK